MSTEQKIKQLETKLKSKAYLSFHGDGLIDILMGWNLIGAGVFLYTHSIIYSWIGLLPLILYKPLKERIVLPRLGHASFRTRRTPSMWLIGGLGGLFILAAVIFGFIMKDTVGFTGSIAIALFGIAFLMVLTTGFNRIFAYAILIPLFFVAGLGLGYLSPVGIIITGAVVMVIGIGMLINFIQKNPIRETGE